MSDRPASAYAYYAQRTAQALRVIAEAPRSVSELEEHLQVGGNAARRLIGQLVDDGLVEQHPDSNRQHPARAP
jgi:DNA-binding IclR family transcriptional regulator